MLKNSHKMALHRRFRSLLSTGEPFHVENMAVTLVEVVEEEVTELPTDPVDEIFRILAQIKYKPHWRLHWGRDGRKSTGRPYLQVGVDIKSEAALSPFTGERAAWKGGKVYLSTHMCKQEVVAAAFGAFKAAEEHEMREWFTYRNARVYGPHFDPDALAKFARDKRNLCLRQNAITMDEVDPTEGRDG